MNIVDIQVQIDNAMMKMTTSKRDKMMMHPYMLLYQHNR